MAARKRASADASTETKPQEKPKSQGPTPAEPPTAPLKSKSSFIVKLSLLLLGPYLYLIFHHYKIDQDLKRSIIINAGLSLAGFFVTVKLIPVASRYVIRRNLFGYDINKKGTPGGTLRVWVFFSCLSCCLRVVFDWIMIWVCVRFWFLSSICQLGVWQIWFLIEFFYWLRVRLGFRWICGLVCVRFAFLSNLWTGFLLDSQFSLPSLNRNVILPSLF